MALETLLSPQTAASTAGPIVCDGISAITIGLYSTAALRENVGALITMDDPVDTENLNSRGRTIVLTQANPVITIRSAGSYYIIKPVTAQAVGVYGYSNLLLISAPSNQSILTNAVSNTLTANRNADWFADAVGIGSGTPSLLWTPGGIDLDVDLTAVAGTQTSDPIKVAVAAASTTNQTLSAFAGMNATTGQADPNGGTDAVLITATAGVGNHYRTTSSAAVSNNNTSGEIWAKIGTTGKLVVYQYPGSNKIATYDMATGQRKNSQMGLALVEQVGDWYRFWWELLDDDPALAKSNTLYIGVANDDWTHGNFDAAGTEALTVFRPRIVDGALPLTPYQLCGFYRNGSTAFGAETWQLTTPYNNVIADMIQPATKVDVLLPDTYTTAKQYRVIYLMPVEAVVTTYADELAVIESLDLHNTMDCIFVRPVFWQNRTWGGIKNDGNMNHDNYISVMLTGFMDEFYSTRASREGRTIMGYSAAGFAAMSQMQRNPEVWGYCVAWDVPWLAAYAAYDQAQHFGTEAQYNLFNPYNNVAAQKAAYTDKARLIYGGYAAFGADTSAMYSLLVTELGVPMNNGGGDYATTITNPDALWWKIEKVEASHNFTSNWVNPATTALQVLWDA